MNRVFPAIELAVVTMAVYLHVSFNTGEKSFGFSIINFHFHFFPCILIHLIISVLC